MTFLFEFISSIVEEVNWRRRMAIEQRIAYSVTAALALTFVAAAVGNVVLRMLSRRIEGSTSDS